MDLLGPFNNASDRAKGAFRSFAEASAPVLSKLGALGSKAYAYKPKAGVTLRHFNIESQAEIARHLYLARIGEPEQDAPERAWLEQVWRTR